MEPPNVGQIGNLPHCKFLRAAIVGAAAVIGFFGVLLLGPRSSRAGTAAATGTEFPVVPIQAASKLEHPPGYNFALAAHGAKVSVSPGGTSAEQLIDGNDTLYTGGTGFAMTIWNASPPQNFLVSLKKPVAIDCIRFLLWDRSEDRYYRYKLEVCADEKGQNWTMIADRSGPTEECKSWQTVCFDKRTVKLIRLTGTFNSSNSHFHVVELQASLGVPPGAETTKSGGLEF